jgi:hypothetical protein
VPDERQSAVRNLIVYIATQLARYGGVEKPLS